MFEDPSRGEVVVEDHRFPCVTCGADLRYAPGTDHLICDHCGATEEILGPGAWARSALAELDFRQAVANQLPAEVMEETRVIGCPNCGAQVEFHPDTHAKECPFCATPVVTDTGTHRHFKPKGVLPFALSEEEARGAMVRWLGSLWFAPGGLQKFARNNRRLEGIYVPFWTYDADTRSRYTGQRGTVRYETRTRTVNGERKQVTVTKVDWRPVSGRVARYFDDVLVLGARSLPKDYTDALAPWDLSAMEPYQPEFLAGFRSEGYTVTLEDGYREASQIMERTIRRDIKFDIGGDRQRISSVDTEVGAITFKHILLPIWMAAYKYRGKTYRFVVNARTGQVRGERPWSMWKIAAAVILGLILAMIVGYLIAQQQGGISPVVFELPLR